MDNVDNLLKSVNEEVEESKEILENLANEVRALSDIIEPAILERARSLRAARMTVVQEINLSLNALKEVRRFFFEHEYELEMARLERFVKVCKEIQELKKSGVLDAVAETAIRLALKEPPT